MSDLELSGKRDVKSRVIRYLTVADITLNADEEAILIRWEAADQQMREKKKTHAQIVEFIALRYHVSKHTAQNDVAIAQDVFARARSTNKKYHLHLHAERVDAMIERITTWWQKKDIIPDAKEMAALARLYDSYTRTMDAMPQDKEAGKTPPPIMLFNLVAGEQIITPMSLDDAKAMADQLIKKEKKEQDAEDIDHEEL